MALRGLLLFVFVSGCILSVVLYAILFDEVVPDNTKIADKWWGAGQRPKSDVKQVPIPFKVSVSDAELQDLQNRLQNTRFSKGLEGINFEYGMNHEYLKEFVTYWSTKYDWRTEEKKLNKYPQFLLKINGIDIHYVHAKPKSSTNKKVVPILMSHGWPGSVVEFYNVIDHLITPRKDTDFVFEVICPHIPGYGFSEAAHKPGLGYIDTALIFTKLMTGLGHDRFYVQGGDWGSAIVSAISTFFPERVIGMHLNMAPQSMKSGTLVRWVLGSIIPSIAPGAPAGSPSIYPISAYLARLVKFSGYFHLQATLPDSLGASLIDSPAGMAAYILDKFAYGTNMAKAADKFDGGLSVLNKDELITNLMVYWFSKTITSSLRFYKEAFYPETRQLQFDKMRTKVPTGLLLCEREPLLGSTMLAWDRYENITEWKKTSKCGHFAAMENPLGFAESVWNFVHKIQS